MEEIKKEIRSILISAKHGVSEHDILKDYDMLLCKPLPFRQLGFPNAVSLLRAMPDVMREVRGSNGEITFHAVSDASTAHIQKLVSNQNSKKKKSRGRGGYSFRGRSSYGRSYATKPAKPLYPYRGRGGRKIPYSFTIPGRSGDARKHFDSPHHSHHTLNTHTGMYTHNASHTHTAFHTHASAHTHSGSHTHAGTHTRAGTQAHAGTHSHIGTHRGLHTQSTYDPACGEDRLTDFPKSKQESRSVSLINSDDDSGSRPLSSPMLNLKIDVSASGDRHISANNTEITSPKPDLRTVLNEKRNQKRNDKSEVKSFIKSSLPPRFQRKQQKENFVQPEDKKLADMQMKVAERIPGYTEETVLHTIEQNWQPPKDGALYLRTYNAYFESRGERVPDIDIVPGKYNKEKGFYGRLRYKEKMYYPLEILRTEQEARFSAARLFCVQNNIPLLSEERKTAVPTPSVQVTSSQLYTPLKPQPNLTTPQPSPAVPSNPSTPQPHHTAPSNPSTPLSSQATPATTQNYAQCPMETIEKLYKMTPETGLFVKMVKSLYENKYHEPLECDPLLVFTNWNNYFTVDAAIQNRYIVYPVKNAFSIQAQSPSLQLEGKAKTQCIVHHMPAVGSSLEVIFSFAYSAVEIYLRKSQIENLVYEIEESLNSFCPTTQPPALSALTAGSLVAAFYGEGWYRASVKVTGPQDQVTVYFVDYGNSETVELKDLRPLPDADLPRSTPALAFRCACRKTQDGEWIEDVVSVLDNITQQHTVLKASIIDHSGDCCVIDLFTPEGSLVNSMLMKPPASVKTNKETDSKLTPSCIDEGSAKSGIQQLNGGQYEVQQPTTIVAQQPTTMVAQQPTTMVAQQPTIMVAQQPTLTTAQQQPTATTAQPTMAAMSHHNRGPSIDSAITAVPSSKEVILSQVPTSTPAAGLSQPTPMQPTVTPSRPLVTPMQTPVTSTQSPVTPAQPSMSRLFAEDPPPLVLPEDDEFSVYVCKVVSECSVIIRIVDENYSDKLDELEEKIGRKFNQWPQPKELKKTNIYAAVFMPDDDEDFEEDGDDDPNEYHRVRFIKEENGKCLCYLPDHGDHETIDKSNLREIDTKLNVSLPYQAVLAKLSGLEDIPLKYRSFATKILIKMLITDSMPFYALRSQKGPEEQLNIDALLINRVRKIISCCSEVDPKKVAQVYEDIYKEQLSNTEDIIKHIPGYGFWDDCLEIDLIDTEQENEEVNINTEVLEALEDLASGKDVRDVLEELFGSEASSLTGSEKNQLMSSEYSSDVDEGELSAALSRLTSGPDTQERQDRVQSYVAQSASKALYTWGTTPAGTPDPATPVGTPGPATPVGTPDPSTPSLSDKFPVYWKYEVFKSTPVYIMHVESPSNFVAIPVEMFEKLNKLEEALSKTLSISSSKPTALSETEVYAVKCGDLYSRALYIKPLGEMVKVFLPDHHRFEVVDEVYVLPEEFYSLPFLAYRMRLGGVSPQENLWSEESKTWFVESVARRSLYAIILGEDRTTSAGVVPSSLVVELIDTSGDDDVIVAEHMIQVGMADQEAVRG